jgi:hypothetical protein
MITDKQFLQWVHDRLRYGHGENIHMDSMHKLRAIIEATPDSQVTPNRASHPHPPETPA